MTLDFNLNENQNIDRETRNAVAYQIVDDEVKNDAKDFRKELEKFQNVWEDFHEKTFGVGDKMGFDETLGKFVIYPNTWYQGVNRWFRGENRTKNKNVFDKWEKEFILFETELEMYVDYLPNTRLKMEPILKLKNRLKEVIGHVQSIYEKNYT